MTFWPTFINRVTSRYFCGKCYWREANFFTCSGRLFVRVFSFGYNVKACSRLVFQFIFLLIFTVCLVTRELEFIINCDSNEKKWTYLNVCTVVFIYWVWVKTPFHYCAQIYVIINFHKTIFAKLVLNSNFYIGSITLKCDIFERRSTVYPLFVPLITSAFYFSRSHWTKWPKS